LDIKFAVEKESDTIMKRTLLLILLAASCALAQEKGNVVYRSASVSGMAFGGFDRAPVQGAPYSATINNESIQTLADGNRIVQTSTGTTARDSQGRTRHDTALPAIGNLSAANAPRLVFLQDPVAQTSYTLNFTDKTAQKMPVFSAMAGGAAGVGPVVAMKFGEVGGPPQMLDPLPSTMATQAAGQVFIQKHIDVTDGPALRVDAEHPAMMLRKHIDEQASASTEDLGSQTMEGVLVNGVRTTHTIPAGQIGNERPITIVTEIWTSPDLKTVVLSKRSDPRMGEQTFRLTNIVRAEPDPSLFTVPADFKIVEGPQPIRYRTKE
jgi:hypothetical protein